jgi:hypothetical protein
MAAFERRRLDAPGFIMASSFFSSMCSLAVNSWGLDKKSHGKEDKEEMGLKVLMMHKRP